MPAERDLRLFACLATAIATPLNIVSTTLSLIHEQNIYWHRRSATTFCFVFIPLAMTIVASSRSLQYIKKHGKTPTGRHLKALDLVSALTYIAVLVPIWAVEIRKFDTGGFGLLVGYATVPMILNMIVHVYFALNQIPWQILLSSHLRCAECHAKLISGASQTTTKNGYSLLRGENYLDVEADAIQYRDSEDFLGEGARSAEEAEQPEQDEGGSKGKDVAVV